MASVREDRFEYWETTRQIGKRAFVIRYGVLAFGLLSAYIKAAIEVLFFDGPFLTSFILHVPFFMLSGAWWGMWVWNHTERG